MLHTKHPTAPKEDSGLGMSEALSDTMSQPDTIIDLKDDAPATTSIYDLHTRRHRYTVLFVASFASILLPFSDTIYLPALTTVEADLNTSAALVAASVSIYMFTVGIFSLFWGPFADRFGRRIAYFLASAVFVAVTVVCIVAPNITVLVIFRALQGAAVAAYGSVGQGAIADVFPPEVRGMASGIFMVPLLVGPILGPLIGGGLSQALGWRSTFVALVIAAGLAFILILACYRETHQYLVLQRHISKQSIAEGGNVVAKVLITEAPTIQKPVFMAPWGPLKFLIEADVAPHALVAIVVFSSMFISLTELPVALAAPPYSLSEGIIGVCYLPVGIAGFLASMGGGRVSDLAASRYPSVPEARLIPATIGVLVLAPIGFLMYGWTFQYRTHLAGPLIAHGIIGIASAIYLPGMFSYLSSKKQNEAAAAASGIQSMMFVMAGVCISLAVIVVNAIGFGPTFTICAALCFLLTCIAGFIIRRKVHAALQQQQQRQTEVAGALSDKDAGTFTSGMAVV
eukprot:jgi/Chrzof1/5761/Cz16g14250.t1